MLDQEELKKAFGEADEEFVKKVYSTLDDIQQNRSDENVNRKRISIIIPLVAVMVVFITTAAFAINNQWGVLDFITQRGNNIEVLPDAEKEVQTSIEQAGGETTWVDFHVRQAVNENNHLYIVVEAKPKKPEYMILGADSMLEDPIRNLGNIFENQDMTIEEYANKNAKSYIHTSIGSKGVENGEGMVNSLYFTTEQDGTLVYMIEAVQGNKEEQLELICAATPFMGKQIDHDRMEQAVLSFSVDTAVGSKMRTNVNTAQYEDCGVRVEQVTLIGGKLATYVEIEYTVTDEKNYEKTDQGLWFEILDEKGVRVADGALSSGESGEIKGEKGRYRQKFAIQSTEELPNEILLRGFNAWEKNRYETHTFEMKEK